MLPRIGHGRRRAYVRERTDGRGGAEYSQGSLPMKGRAMLYTVVVLLLILWALGLVTSYTMGGLIHILLVVAVIVLLVNLLSGRRV
jgi:Family of unknown function (DUF5670)